jgi:6-phosphogluconolactonase
MELRVLPDEQAVAEAAADFIAREAQAAVAARGRFVMAVSGGRTPWRMLEQLSVRSVPWRDLHVFQVDERVAPAGDDVRNLTHLQASLLERAAIPAANVHAMPVEADDLEGAARAYGAGLAACTGSPAVLDLVHLGLGPDGHTASLVPGSALLDEARESVGVTAPYQGHRRMTLTFPVIDRARRVLWVVTGPDKAGMLRRLRAADPTIPAGRVRQEFATVLADRAAAGENG